MPNAEGRTLLTFGIRLWPLCLLSAYRAGLTSFDGHEDLAGPDEAEIPPGDGLDRRRIGAEAPRLVTPQCQRGPADSVTRSVNSRPSSS